MPNKKKLYEALKKEGYDNFADEESFNQYIGSSENRKTLFNALKEEGYDNFANEAEFDDYLGYGRNLAEAVSNEKPQTQPEEDDIFEENQRLFAEGKPTKKVTTQSIIDAHPELGLQSEPQLSKTDQYILDNKPEIFGGKKPALVDIPLGDTDELSNERLGKRLEIAQSNQKERTKSRLQSISDEISTAMGDLQERVEVSEIDKLRPANMQYMPTNPVNKELMPEYTALRKARRLVEESENIIEEASKKGNTNFVAGLARGFWDNLNAEDYTFGADDAEQSAYLLRALDKAEKGEELTKVEETLLDAAAINMATQAFYAQDLGKGYKAGSVTAESIPFMMEMAINPISSFGKASAKQLLNYGLKRFVGNAVKGLAKGAAAGAGMAATTGIGRVAEGTTDRLAENYNYGVGLDGQLYVEKERDMGIGEAAARSFASTAIENQSEMIFNAFRGAGQLMKGLDKYIPGGVNTFFDAVKNSKVGQIWKGIKNSPLRKDFMEATNIGGIGEEYLEEVYNNLANFAIGEMEWKDVVSLDNNIDTFLGLAPTQAIFMMLGLGNMGAIRYQTKRDIENLRASMNEQQQRQLDELLSMGKVASNLEVRDLIHNTVVDQSLTSEQKRASIEAAYNIAMSNAAEQIAEAETQDRVETENATIDAMTDPSTGKYAELTRKMPDGVGGTVEQQGYIVGWIGNAPVFVPEGMENTVENRVVLQPSEWDSEAVQEMDNAEVKALNEEMIREEAANQAEMESKYAPEVLDAKMERGKAIDTPSEQIIPVEPMPEGNGWIVEVYAKDTNNKVAAKPEVKEMTTEVFRDMLQAQYEAEQAVAEQLQEQIEEAVEGAPVAEQPTIATEEAVQPVVEEAKPQVPVIPTKEDGSIDFVSYGKEGSFQELGKVYGEKMPHKVEVTAKALAEDMAKAQAALDKAQEAVDNAPIGREAKAKAALDKAQQEFDAVKREADFWNEMDADIKAAQAEREAILNPKIEEMGEEPMTADEFVAQQLANGNIALTVDSYKKETGYGEAERKKFPKMFRKAENGGMTIERAGERLMEIASEEGLPFFDQNDPNAGRDALLNVLGSVQSWGDVTGYIRSNRERQAERESEGFRDEMEDAAIEAHYDSLEDYVLQREWAEVDIPFEGVDINEKMAIFAEAAAEYENYLNQQENGQGTTEEDAEGTDDVLSEEQSDNTGRTEEQQEPERTDEGIADESEAAHAGEQEIGQRQDETILEYAERIDKEEQRRRPLRERANEWGAKLGVKVNIIENINDVTNKEARKAILNGERVTGWYEESTEEVCLYIPYITSEKEIDATYIHEVVAHKGVRGLLGDKFDEFCDNVWDMMSNADRAKFMSYPGVSHLEGKEKARAAADEYIAHLAENIDVSGSVWNKFTELLRKFLKAIGIEPKMSDAEIANTIKLSYQRLMEGGAENVGGEGTRFNAKRISDRRQEMNRVNNTVDQALSLVYGKDIKEIRKERQEQEQKRKEDAEEIYQSVLSGDFNDVTLQKINDYIDDATPLHPYGKRISQRLPQKLERDLHEGSRTNAVDALFSRIHEKAVPASRRASEAGRREIEERKKESLKGWAIATNNWHTDLSEFTDEQIPIGEGTDSKVYASKDGKYVIKTSFGKPEGKRFRPDIDNIPLFNHVFRNSAYEIVGYGEFDGKFARILKQPFVEFAEDSKVSVDERVDYMHTLGFEPINEAKTAFSNGMIIVADLQKSNIVKDVQGNVRVIDADVKLHTKDVGGNYTYPSVEADLPENTRFRTVYHGSAASFDKFDHSFMGTGEGNQSFGWGTYVTDVEGIGRKYASIYANNSPLAATALRWIEENDTYGNFLAKGEGKRRNYAIRHAKDFLKELKEDGASEDVIKAYEQDLRDAEDALSEENYNRTKENMIASLNRNLYEVEIPDNDGTNYIAWDKMLPKEQAERIKEAVRNSEFFKEYEKEYGKLAEERLDAWTKTSGGRAYKLLGNFTWLDNDADKAISQLLSKAGFVGFEYPANYMSGGNNFGQNNYVIFNEDDLKIVKHTRFRTVTDKNGKKSLVGLHNISEEKLRKAIKQGGLANPSMAVIDLDKQSHVDYGDITLIAPIDLIDKKSGRNIGTYMADAYTPIYPTVVKKMSDKGAKEFTKALESVDETFRSKVRTYFNSYLDTGTMYDALYYWYLSDTGKNPPTLKTLLPEGFTMEEIEKVKSVKPDAYGFYDLSNDEKQEVVRLYADRFYGGMEGYKEYLDEYVSKWENSDKSEAKLAIVRRQIESNLNAIKEYGYEYDRIASYYSRVLTLAERQSKPSEMETFRNAFNEVKKSGLEEDFGNWLLNKESELGVEEMLFVGYDNQGRAKYKPNTLENASKLMKKEGRAGATGLGGFNYFVAILAPVAKDTKQINKKKQNLSTQEEYDEFAKKWGEHYHDLALQLQPGADKWADYGYHRLHEIAPMANPKEYVKKEYGIELSDRFIKDLNDVKNAIKNDFPARYFETKFERPVYLNEFAAAVVPQGTSEDVVNALKEAGLPVEEYEKDNNEARMEAVDKVSSEMESVRFRIANRNQEIFVSNAQRAVEGIKQEKATPQQWLAMIEKNSGLKAGEDKWLGLSDWLKASDKKSLTKNEILGFIGENKIVIEEVKYASRRVFNDEGKVESDAPINSTRLNYTTKGLENKQEIALTVPTIEAWNEVDEVHFGDAGQGRAIAWIRFGETTGTVKESSVVDDYLSEMRSKYNAAEGEEVDYMSEDEVKHLQSLTSSEFNAKENAPRILVIDEIQSKRHQEGREQGYMPIGIRNVQLRMQEIEERLEELGRIESESDFGLTDEQYDEQVLLLAEQKELVKSGTIPSAPFEKNWSELAFKRMLRYAAENGYDKVAWTTGSQQAERYSLSNVIDSISISKSRNEEGKYYVTSWDKETMPISTASGSKTSEELKELFGKGIAQSLIEGVDNLEEGSDTFTLEGTDLEVGGEGMKGFYDKMLPSFVNKYVKKWGTKVQDIELPNVEEAGRIMHSVDVTEAMKESVMEGQTMFRVKMDDTKKTVDAFTSKYNSKPVVVIDSEMTDEELEEIIPGELADNIRKGIATGINGGYDYIGDKIYIFADNVSPEDIEDALFHENHHAQFLNDKHIINEFYENSIDKFPKNKSQIRKEGYSEELLPEELFVRILADAETKGDFHRLEKYLSKETYNELINLLKENGYDIEKEIDARRGRGRSRIASTRSENGEIPLQSVAEESERSQSRELGRVRSEISGQGERAREIRQLFDQVADNGLRGVVGDDIYDRSMLEMYRSLPMEAREKVAMDALSNHDADMGKAIDKFVSESYGTSSWDIIVGAIRNMLRKKGFDIRFSDNDIRYLVWRNRQKLNRSSIIDVAEDIDTRFRIYGGNSGYVGYSMSKRAAEAREDGRYPKTDFKKEYGVTENSFNILVEAGIIDDSEWHHTSKFGNKTTFYSWNEEHYFDIYTSRKKEIDKKSREIQSMKPKMADFELSQEGMDAFTDKDREYWEAKKSYANQLWNEFNEDDGGDTPGGGGTKFRVSKEKVEGFSRIYKDFMADEYGLPDYAQDAVESAWNKMAEDMKEQYGSTPYEFFNNAGEILTSKWIKQYEKENPYIKDFYKYNDVVVEGNDDAQDLMDGILDVVPKSELSETANIEKYIPSEVLEAVVLPNGKSFKFMNADVVDLLQRITGKTKAEVLDEYSKDGIDMLTDEDFASVQNGGKTRFRVSGKLNIRDEYEALTKKGKFQAREALQDAMLSLRRVQEMIEKATGKKLRDFENAWMHENRLSSVVQAEIHEMERKFYKPMMNAVSKLAKAMGENESYSVADYLILKHGIERNREMAVRKALTDSEGKIDRAKLDQWYQDKAAIRNDASLDTWRKKQEAMDNAALNYGADMSVDYSGLTSMFDTDDLADSTDRAYKEVETLETAHPTETKALGDAVKDMTQSSLDKAFESGLMDRKVYDELSKDMYDYYIPLRGFEETTSDEVYAYMDNDRGAFNAPLVRAKGRTSKSDNPLAYMKSIAESGIMQGNRNKMKQTFLNMVINNPSDLVSVKEGVWAMLNPTTGEWEAVSAPPIPNNATPAEIENIMENWEAQMERNAQSDPNVKKVREADDVPYRVVGNRINQHQIIVKRLGKSYTLTINGNPRLAMALNGQTNPNNTSNDGKVAAYVSGKIDAVNRNLAAWYTTRNPDFVASNFMRDTFYTNTIVRAKEGNSYANKFHKQYARLLMPNTMLGLFKKYESGTLDPAKPIERDFLEFMMNGGETGYSNLKDLEQIKKQIEREVKGSRWQKVEDVLEKLDILNRAVENTARFAAYRTSRQMGRSIAKSVFDAKEISVNFNKKGSGGTFFGMTGQTKMGNLAAMLGAGGRAMYVFFNAAIQGTTNLLHAAKVNPVGTSAGLTAMFIMGAVVPYLLGGDDENDYYDLPEHVRRNHLIIPGAGDAWISIPLPIEYRIMYGMGELLTSWRTGHERGENIARKMLSLSGQALPLNFLEEGLDAFVPSAISPLWQSYNNRSWTGLPIYKENEFNKHDPEYTKAYSNTDRNLVKFTNALYDWTFDEENQKEGVDLNPAIIETIARGYFGGMFTTWNNLAKTLSTIQGEREFDWRNIPIANRVFKSGDVRTKEKRITNEYFENIEKYEFMQARERRLKKVINGETVPDDDKREADEEYKIMKGSTVYDKYISGNGSFKAKKKEIDKVYRKRKEKDSEELERKYYKLLDEANKIVR